MYLILFFFFLLLLARNVRYIFFFCVQRTQQQIQKRKRVFICPIILAATFCTRPNKYYIRSPTIYLYIYIYVFSTRIQVTGPNKHFGIIAIARTRELYMARIIFDHSFAIFGGLGYTAEELHLTK